MSNYHGLCYGIELFDTPDTIVYWPLEFDTEPHEKDYFTPKRADNAIIKTKKSHIGCARYFYDGHQNFIEITDDTDDTDAPGYENALVTGAIEYPDSKRKIVSLFCEKSGIITVTLYFGHVFYDTKPLDKVLYSSGSYSLHGGIVGNERIETKLIAFFDIDLGRHFKSRLEKFFPKTK